MGFLVETTITAKRGTDGSKETGWIDFNKKREKSQQAHGGACVIDLQRTMVSIGKKSPQVGVGLTRCGGSDGAK